jgi:hypothetical protein
MMQKETELVKEIDSQRIKANHWQQGAFLLVDENTSILIETPSMKDYLPEGLYIVLTQDCDLLNSDLQKEPVAELILTSKIVRAKPQYLSGQNPRILHLELNSMEASCSLEFFPQKRFFIARNHLENEVATEFLDPKHLKILIRWVANRYKRSGFPDSFNQRLRGKIDTVKKILDEYGHNTLGLFIRLSTEKELSEDEPYGIYVVMLVEKSTYAQTDKLEKIQEGFDKISALLSQIQGINLLDDSDVQSMDEISAHQYGLLKQWDFDYLSFSNERNGITSYDIGM